MGNRKIAGPIAVISIILIVLCVLFESANAQINSSSKVGTTSANFLKIGVGARASALGGAFVAVADDATANYWNPAGLSSLSSSEIIFMHNDWYQDIKIEYLGAAFPVSNSFVLGIGVSYLDYGSFEGYDDRDQPTEELSANAMVVSSSGSFLLSDNLSLGITGKFFTEQLDESSASGYAMDLGALYRVGVVTFGLNVRDLGSGLQYENESYPLPSRVTGGIAVNAYGGRLRFATDVDKPEDNGLSLHQGIEYCYENTVFLRTGYSHQFNEIETDGSGSGMSLGFGVKHSVGAIDYSYLPNAQIGDVHRISFRVCFGGMR